MGWITDDGLHEGYAVPLFSNGDQGNGAVGGGADLDRIRVLELWDAEAVADAERTIAATGTNERGWRFHRDSDWDGRPTGYWYRLAAEVIGWQVLCHCYTPHPHGVDNIWSGPVFDRVPSAALHKPAKRKIYSTDEDVTYVVDDEDVDAALRAAWRLRHADAHAAEAEVRVAADEAGRARAALDQAVAAARTQGLSWETIGRATSMTRQSAHGRWGHAETAVAHPETEEG